MTEQREKTLAHSNRWIRLTLTRFTQVQVSIMKAMQAGVGDRIVVRRHKVGEPDRAATVLEVRGDGGQPPYIVRWTDGHVGYLIPGSDAFVEPASDTVSDA